MVTFVALLVGCLLTAAFLHLGWHIGRKQSSEFRETHCSGTVLATPEVSAAVSPTAISIETSFYKVDGKVRGGVLGEIFSQLHHPSVPLTTELILDLYHPITPEMKATNPYEQCQEVYMTRTGSATSMSNKCLSLAVVSEGDTSPYMHSYRMGTSAKLINKYQGDTVDAISLREEKVFLPLFLKNLHQLVTDFQAKMGNPVLPNGERKAITIMVANEGVMDLVLNFLCSCRSANIDTSNMIIFLGSPDLAPLIENMGVVTYYNEALGPIPKKAATFYGDNVFGVLMWLKTTSVYVASKAGYNVLFQDTDLVWIKDPMPVLQKHEHDIIFMDDGARTPRFTPFYVNSGFYYQKYNNQSLFLMEKMIKSISEIAGTHSHQATLTRHITEAHHLMGLQVAVLSQEEFPSGILFHHDKEYIKRMVGYKVVPTVFHMCWTTSRAEKVTYFQEIGMWFLPDGDATCETAAGMQLYLSRGSNSGEHGKLGSLMQRCCQKGVYWEKQPQTIPA